MCYGVLSETASNNAGTARREHKMPFVSYGNLYACFSCLA